MRECDNSVAVLVIIGKRAGDKEIPDIEMAQFDFRAKADVAGEESENGRLGQRLQIVNETPDAGQQVAFAFRQNMVKPGGVAVEEQAEIVCGGFEAMPGEQLPRDAGVRAAGELHVLDGVSDFELGGEGELEGFDARAIRVNERAIDIKQNQSHHLRRDLSGVARACKLIHCQMRRERYICWPARVEWLILAAMTRMLNNARNPAAARLLLFLVRNRIPVIGRVTGILLGCDIACKPPKSLVLPHPYGIVIHSAAVLGEGVVILHQVTIGARNVDDRAPVIEDSVFIGAGAKVLGGVRVGRHATIGANAVVTRDVPAGATIIGMNEILKSGDGIGA
jgi:serine O-acetyltransferase